MKENTSIRLKKIMSSKNLKQVDILRLSKPYCEKYDVKMNKSDLSQYVSGKNEPSQDKLIILSMALDVDPAWLMGFDVLETKIIHYASEVPSEWKNEAAKSYHNKGKETVEVLTERFFDIINSSDKARMNYQKYPITNYNTYFCYINSLLIWEILFTDSEMDPYQVIR